MKAAAIAIIPVLLAIAAPAAACLPPPPGTFEPPPPSPVERARRIHDWATDIVYGVVIRADDDEGRYRFRVLHVYKGSLRPDQMISASSSFGFDPPPCLISPPPPTPRGSYGVIAFHADRPELSFLSDRDLQEMFDANLIVRAAPARISRR